MNEKMFEPTPDTEVGYGDTLIPETEEIAKTEREFIAASPETLVELPRFEIDPSPANADTVRNEGDKESLTETMRSVEGPQETIESTDEVSGVSVVSASELPSGYARKDVPNFETSSLGEVAPILDASGEPIKLQHQELFEESQSTPQESTESGTLKSQNDPPNDTLKAA